MPYQQTILNSINLIAAKSLFWQFTILSKPLGYIGITVVANLLRMLAYDYHMQAFLVNKNTYILDEQPVAGAEGY